MDAQLFGTVDRPAVIVVSTWDPLLPTLRGYVQHLVEYARMHRHNAVAVVLDPAPQRYLRGAANWPVYTSFRARAHCLLAAGLDGVVRVDFQEGDLQLGVYELLDSVRARIPISEVWMRPQQTFGQDTRGSAIAVAVYAKKHGLTWKRPDAPQTKPLVVAVQQHLRRGEVAAARAIVGSPPMWSQPESGEFEVAWRPGHYTAQPGVFGNSVGNSDPLVLELHGDADGLSRVLWPGPDIEHLTILSGPGDGVVQPELQSKLDTDIALAV